MSIKYDFSITELKEELQIRMKNHTKEINVLLICANVRTDNKEDLLNYCNEIKGELRNALFTINFMINKIKEV